MPPAPRPASGLLPTLITMLSCNILLQPNISYIYIYIYTYICYTTSNATTNTNTNTTLLSCNILLRPNISSHYMIIILCYYSYTYNICHYVVVLNVSIVYCTIK